MKRTILSVAILGVLAFAGLHLYSQTFGAQLTGGLLSACPTSGLNDIRFCNVANDPANPSGTYLSGNGAPYFKLSAVVQQAQITPAQLPSKFTCSLSASVSNSSSATLTNCQ